MIVLAIVAAITAGIFVMAGTLRRNSRDNTRTADLGLISGAFTDYVLNSNDIAPKQVGGTKSDLGNSMIGLSLQHYKTGTVTGGTTVSAESNINKAASLHATATSYNNGDIPELAAPAAHGAISTGTIKGGTKATPVATAAAIHALPGIDELIIVKKAKCYNTNGELATNGSRIAATTNDLDIAVIYQLEKHETPQCWQALTR